MQELMWVKKVTTLGNGLYMVHTVDQWLTGGQLCVTWINKFHHGDAVKKLGKHKRELEDVEELLKSMPGGCTQQLKKRVRLEQKIQHNTLTIKQYAGTF